MTTRRIIAAVFGTLSLAFAGVGTFGIILSHEPPIARAELGLTEEGAAALQQLVGGLSGTDIVNGNTDEENRTQRVMLDQFLYEAAGNRWPFHGPQETGDCNAFATALCVEIDTAKQWKLDPNKEWHPVDRPANYALGRFDDGELKIRGQGSFPSLSAANMMTEGVLFADLKAEDGTPVPPYSGKRSADWGTNGIPEKFRKLMVGHTVEDIQSCKTAQGVCNQIVDAKNPVFFGSMNWGTNKIKLVEGRNVALWTDKWAHAEAFTGYDGTLKNGQRLFRVAQSWGPNKHTPHSQIPGDRPGFYYVTWETVEAICKEKMVFALAGTKGFERQDIKPDFTIPVSAAGPQADGDNAQFAAVEGEPMFPMDPDWSGLVWSAAGLFALLALAAWFVKGNRSRRAAMTAAVLVWILSAATMPATAQDWSGIVTAAKAPPSPTPTSVGSNEFSESIDADLHAAFGNIVIVAMSQPVETGTTAAIPSPDFGGIVRAAFATDAFDDPRLDKLIEAAEPPKKVCACKGTNTGVCMCLQAKTQCHCSAHVGSVWQQLMSGIWEKTAAKADPNKPLPTAKPSPATATPKVDNAQAPAAPSGHWVNVTVCDFDRRGRKTGCHVERRWVND